MKKLGEVFDFLVSSPRRKFANRIGLFLGKASVAMISILLSISLFLKWGLMGCGPCLLLFAPILPFLEILNIKGLIPEFAAYIFFSFFVYYVIGYLLGVLFFGLRNFFGEGTRDWKG